MKIGYARKSTHLQDVAHQVDELTKAGCEQIYQDQTSRSGPKRDKKGAPELENCLKALREGDTLVVWALDRLGGSLGQVITLLDDLKKRGITFIAIKDRIDTNAPVIGEIYTHLMAIFSALLLEGFEAHGFRTIRNKRYTGDGGIDGQVIIGKYRYLIQAKRYRGHIALQHVQEFEKLLKRHNCRGLFCHTGKTGAGSKSVSIASERMEIISGQRLIDLLTPGSSFTIATAPQTMMKRTAATLETSTIVKDAGKENRYHES